MPHVDTPWIGLAALAVMFALPFAPSWLFEGPRTIKHRPRRHVCADCGAPWEEDHVCSIHRPATAKRLRGHLVRMKPTAAIESRTASPPETGNF
jgi:hypothetical protein